MLYETVVEYTDAIRRVRERNRCDKNQFLRACARCEKRNLDTTNLYAVRFHVAVRDALFIQRLKDEREQIKK